MPVIQKKSKTVSTDFTVNLKDQNTKHEQQHRLFQYVTASFSEGRGDRGGKRGGGASFVIGTVPYTDDGSNALGDIHVK